jgi:hypothetical protein
MENTEIKLKKVIIYPLKKEREKRITKLVRITVQDLDFLKYYAEENHKTLSKMLSDVLYSYEIRNI